MTKALEDSLLFEIIKAAGFQQSTWSRWLFRLVFGRAIRKFSLLASEFDQEIERSTRRTLELHNSITPS